MVGSAMTVRPALIAALGLLAAACARNEAIAPPSEAAAPQAAPQTTTGEAPPTVNGLYEYGGICPGEGGCLSSRWRAVAPIDVFERTDSTSLVIATLAPGDWVNALDGLTRIVPVRGIVRTADQGLEPGDIVYRLDAHGEGDFTLWRRGERLSWMWPYESEREAYIQWDPPAPDGPTLGWWVQVRLANSRVGWVHNPRDFACMDGRPDDTAGC
jgi:hypothetical protein